ncbi:helix-turn-helix domain-containing protein [Streptomyces capparidis]
MSEHQPDQYTIIGDHLTQHAELSLIAIGLGVYLQSLPDGAQVDIRTLTERFPEGRNRVAAALRELEQHGYIKRERERTPEGQIVTRTYVFNNPEATRARMAREAAARRTQRPGLAAVPDAPEEPEPPRSETPPAPAATRPAPPPAHGQPRPPASEEDRTAAAVLAELRRHDPRLLLSQRDVHRLTPAAATWLRRGAAPEALRRALTASIPPDLRHPAALLAHRLTALLPPPLPAAAQAPHTRPDPFQTCDGCDRAFRAPAPGLCRDCGAADGPTTAPTAA